MNRMKIAMEIPYAHLEELSRYTDFDFALAHMVLEQGPYSTYTRFYRRQAEKGREVWLDNSYHELQQSLDSESLVEAARMINATHVVAPETRDDWFRTLMQIQHFKGVCAERGLQVKVVGSWQGYKKTLRSLLKVCDEVALPFSRPRARYLTPETSRLFHYFGFRNLDELRRLPPKSIDTSLPIRAALFGWSLSTLSRRPRLPKLDFRARLSDKALELVVHNLQEMRRAASTLSPAEESECL